MKTAMILAAGRGERLKPITELHPKALCKVHDLPLIEYHIAGLARAGFQRLIINHAYLGGKIRQQVGDGMRWGVEICYAPEPPGGLETGGGIVNALPLLGKEPFVTVNADIYTDYDFATLQLPTTSLVHLVLVEKPFYYPNGDFNLLAPNLVSNLDRKYTFPGIACYHPEVFQQKAMGRYSVTPILRQLSEKKCVTGEIYHGKWIDIGSLERLEWANKFF